MSDYIKREDAIDAVHKRANKIMSDGYNPKALDVMGVAGLIRDIPSADVVERKRGHWEDCSNGWMCSECFRDVTYSTDFCPACGADMRERKDNE